MSSFDLQRFIYAQQNVYADVLRELAAGKKRTHWMWFIFPQLAGLGSSPMAQRYALSGLPEAAAYLAHPILGQRLMECTGLVNGLSGRTVESIFGFPDNLKLHSSLTLFALVAPPERIVFQTALEEYFQGEQDGATLAILRLNERL